jgi:DNA polymerase I
LHRKTFPTYWAWSNRVEANAILCGHIRSSFGWKLNIGPEPPNFRSLRNFPLQANGAEMLRIACCLLTENGIQVCAPIHDAVLIEAPAKDIDDAVAVTQELMHKASAIVVGGFSLRTEAHIVEYPDRYLVEKNRAMWETVYGHLQDSKERMQSCA